MTTIQIVLLITLVVMFVLAVWRKVNLGLIALPTAYIMSLVAGVPTAKFMAMFPVQLVMLILGITLLFSHAERSGLIKRLVEFTMRHGGSKQWAITTTCFILPAALTAAGAFGPASAAIILPIAYQIAKRTNTNYFSLGVAAIFGAIGGSFSPLSASGALLHSLSIKAGREYATGLLLMVVLAASAIVAAVSIVAIQLLEKRSALLYVKATKYAKNPELVASETRGAHGLAVDEESPHSPRHGTFGGTHEYAAEAGGQAIGRFTLYESTSLCSIVGMLIAVFGFDLDVGFVSLAASLLLLLAFRPPEREMISSVPWPVILLLSGLLMYIGVLESVGVLTAVSSMLSGIGSPVLALLALTYLAAVMSNVESSTILVLGLLAPVALAVVGSSPVALVASFAAIGVCAVAPALNPVHIGGALVLANDDAVNQESTFRKLFLHAGTTTVIVPAVATLVAAPFVA